MARRTIVIASGTAVALLGAAVALGGAGPRTTLTSAGPNGPVEGTSSTFWRSLSGDGSRALFTVDDDNLPGANDTRDVYLRDLETGKTRLVSRTSDGDAANDGSRDDPAISGNGRFVAFATGATNLPGGEGGVYVHDLETKKTKLVSVDSQGEPAGDGSADRPVLSAGGRFVSFEADDDDLPGADGTLDAYVHVRRSGKTSLITKATDGTPVDTDSSPDPAISGSGRFVVFDSDSDVLPGGDGNTEVFIRDRTRGTTTLVSRAPGGDPVPGILGAGGAVSFDGRFVVFESSSAALGADPSGSIFLRDRKRKTTTLASRAEDVAAIGTTASVSANGRYVVYESEDDDLAGSNGTTDVFRYDRKTRKTILLSRASDGDVGDDDSFYVSISAGGSFAAFTSRANNLSGADDDNFSNAFVRGPLD